MEPGSSRLIPSAIAWLGYASPWVFVGAFDILNRGDWVAGLAYAYLILGALISIYLLLGRRYRFIQRSLMALVVACLMVSAVDGLLRLLDYGSPLRPLCVADLPDVYRYRSNLEAVIEVRGSLERISGIEVEPVWKMSFQTDAFGFRNKPHDPRRKLDLIVLGDSFGVGAVPQEATWTALFEERFGLSTYNLSVGGANPIQEVFTLRRHWPRLKRSGCRLVLWTLFSGNDLEELSGAKGSLTNEIPTWLRWNNIFAKRSPLRYAIRKASARFEVSPTRVLRRQLGEKTILFHRGYQEAKNRTLTEVVQHPNYARLQRAFQEMRSFAEEQPIEVAVILVPPKSEVYSWVLSEEPKDLFVRGFQRQSRIWHAARGSPTLTWDPFSERKGDSSTTDRGSYSGGWEIRTGILWGTPWPSKQFMLGFQCRNWVARMPSYSYEIPRSLRGRNDRSEKAGNRGQIFSLLRCIVVLFVVRSGKSGPILPFSQ